MTMELVGFVLLSTLAACLLAGVAMLVGRLVGSPRLRHLLWLLVLARLVAPPVFELGLIPKPANTAALVESGIRIGGIADLGAETHPSSALAAVPVGTESVTGESTSRLSRVPFWAALWAGGGALLLLLYAWQWRRFRTSLEGLEPAGEPIAGRARELAVRMGLRRAPAILSSPHDRPPMVLPTLWRPRVLLPARLIETLSAEELDTILAHELAHVRRRDHLVRVLEVIVVALYWWLPVVWWAKRELRAAEELCCDQAVLAALPSSGPAYARGIMKTLEFVQPTSGVPAMASGMSTFTRMEERLTMITKSENRTTSLRRIPALVIAVVALGVFPTFAARGTQSEEDLAQEAQAQKVAFQREALEIRHRQLEAEQQAMSAKQDLEAERIRIELDQMGQRAQELEQAGDQKGAAEMRAAMARLEQEIKFGRARAEYEREALELRSQAELSLGAKKLEVEALRSEGRHREAEQKLEELMAARMAFEQKAVDSQQRAMEMKNRAAVAEVAYMQSEKARLEAAGEADDAQRLALQLVQSQLQLREMKLEREYESQQNQLRMQQRKLEMAEERAARALEARHVERYFLDQVRQLRSLASELPDEGSLGRLLDQLEVEAERLDAESRAADPAQD
jgi:beta-lactamase regulating signal transducer with metallopeptidase domain